MTRIPRLAVALCWACLLASCTSAPQHQRTDGWEERREAARKMVAESVAFECVDAPEVGYLMVFYTPWDRWDYQSVVMATPEEDFLKGLVESTGRFEEFPELVKVLSGEVNDMVNAELDRIADGSYNAIYVRIDNLLDIGVAPAGENSFHVWVPEERGELGEEPDASTSAQQGSPPHDLWVVDARGQVLEYHDASANQTMVQEAHYQKTWQPWDDPVKFWKKSSPDSKTGPRGRNERWGAPGFWTYAAWPPQVRYNQVRRCKVGEHETIRH